MPTISRFFGITIAMYYQEHGRPHFHVRYGEHKASLAIDSLSCLEGELPPRVLGLVVEWAASHRESLLANWQRAGAREPLEAIAPLE